MCARGAMLRGERMYDDIFYVPGYRMLDQDVIPMFSGPSADVNEVNCRLRQTVMGDIIVYSVEHSEHTE